MRISRFLNLLLFEIENSLIWYFENFVCTVVQVVLVLNSESVFDD